MTAGFILLLGTAILWSRSDPATAVTTSFRFVVMGDTRGSTYGVNETTLRSLMTKVKGLSVQPAFILFTGDQVYGGSDVQTQLNDWSNIVDDYYPMTMIYPALGNHEHNETVFSTVFPHLPNGQLSGYQRSAYYFDYGNTRIITLNSNRRDGSGNYVIDATQRAWLTNVLNNNGMTHNIIQFHVPAYPVGAHYGNSLDSNAAQRDALWDIVDQYNVTAVLVGHEHNYNRRLIDSSFNGSGQTFTNAINQLTIGGGGAPLNSITSDTRNLTVGPLASYQYTVVDIADGLATFKTYDINNNLLDNFSVSRTVPVPAPPIPYSENFESGAAADWTMIDGTWSVITDGTKVLRAPSTDSMARAYVGDTTWRDYRTEAKVKINSWAASGDRSVGLIARYTNPTNYYILNYNATASELRITKQVNGVFTRLATKTAFTLSTGAWHTFKAELVGSSLQLYVNGTLQLSATDSALTAGGAGVMQTNGDVRYDDVAVSRITLLDENFNDGVANGWSVVDGNWTYVTDGTVTYRTPNTDAISRAITGTAWGNYALESKVKINSWGSGDKSVGLMARYQDATNYYILNYNATAGELRITKQVAGVFTRLATKTGVTLSTGTWHTLKAQLNGPTINLYVNGNLELTATDSAFSSGKGGLMQTYGDIRYDDVLVTTP